MNEEEFYMEETNPKSAKRICIGIAFVLIILTVFFGVYRKYHTLNLKDNIVYEAGEKISKDVEDYVVNKIVEKNDYTIILTGIPVKDGILTTPGEYTFKVKFKNITKKGHLVVKDTRGPKVEVKNLTVGVKEEFDIAEFITSCEDYSMPCDVNYVNSRDETLQKKAGDYVFEIVIKDNLGNKTTKKVRLTVKKGYSLEKEKTSDLKIHHADPTFDDWDKSMILTYSEAVDANSFDEDPRYSYLLDLVSGSIREYLPEEYVNNAIVEDNIITVYNKYNYIIGFAYRVKLDNGRVLYLTK